MQLKESPIGSDTEGVGVFQFQEVQLKAKFATGGIAALKKFQFQEVQLKGHIARRFIPKSHISIPRGAVKSCYKSFHLISKGNFNSKRCS